MANVSFVRPELAALLPAYYLIRDVIAGETAIKALRTKYLPMPNPEDRSEENQARYEAYLKRAVFYNVARRTLLGMIGQVFMRDPIVRVPPLLDILTLNATGTGVNLVQLAKKAVLLTLAYSRAGLIVDYPAIDENGTSVADLEVGRIRPTLYVYAPQEIINWRVIDRGAETILSLVVIYETYAVSDDGFEMKNSGQFRVLRLDENGEYVHEIWREPHPTMQDGSKVPKGNYEQYQIFRPKDAQGNPLREIPFMFIGSENNDSQPDNPNFYDLASLNIAHYRNSADYEESCFITGQPTPVLMGLTEEWVQNVLKGTVTFGSRGGIPLPVGADVRLLQASPNTMLNQAMESKERQMVALGAKLVEQRVVQRTAMEARLDLTSESSILSSVAKNVSTAFLWALQWAARWVGQDDSSVVFELNTDFDIAGMSSEERRLVTEEWQKGAITFNEMRSILRKAGVAMEDDDKARADLAKEAAELLGYDDKDAPI